MLLETTKGTHDVIPTPGPSTTGSACKLPACLASEKLPHSQGREVESSSSYTAASQGCLLFYQSTICNITILQVPHNCVPGGRKLQMRNEGVGEKERDRTKTETGTKTSQRPAQVTCSVSNYFSHARLLNMASNPREDPQEEATTPFLQIKNSGLRDIKSFPQTGCTVAVAVSESASHTTLDVAGKEIWPVTSAHQCRALSCWPGSTPNHLLILL